MLSADWFSDHGVLASLEYWKSRLIKRRRNPEASYLTNR